MTDNNVTELTHQGDVSGNRGKANMDEPRATQALNDLVEWVEVWNRVCGTACGDDDKPPPTRRMNTLHGWHKSVTRQFPLRSRAGFPEPHGSST